MLSKCNSYARILRLLFPPAAGNLWHALPAFFSAHTRCHCGRILRRGRAPAISPSAYRRDVELSSHDAFRIRLVNLPRPVVDASFSLSRSE